MNDLTWNERIDQALIRAGGKLYLAQLDRPALERFVREILREIEEDIKSWRDSKDESMSGAYWEGYEQGCTDSIVAVRLWSQDIP
jgi:hypothetical protein